MEFTLQSGAKLIVTPSSFESAQALTKALMKSLKGLELSVDILQTDVKSFFDGLISIATSDEVEKGIFECGKRALYENIKVSKNLFDDEKIGEQAREDYFEICKDIIEVNCYPFFKKLSSGLSLFSPKKAEISQK